MNWFRTKQKNAPSLIENVFSVHIGSSSSKALRPVETAEELATKEEDEDYRDFLDYRKLLVEIQLRSRSALDDRCILVCTTFLALSLTLLQFISGRIQNPLLLVFSVATIIASALATLISMYLSTHLSESALADLDAVCSIRKLAASKTSIWLSKGIDIFHVLQILLLIVGISFFSLFAITNAFEKLFPTIPHRGTKMADDQKQETLINHETGLKIPPPPPPKPIQKLEVEKQQEPKPTGEKK